MHPLFMKLQTSLIAHVDKNFTYICLIAGTNPTFFFIILCSLSLEPLLIQITFRELNFKFPSFSFEQSRIQKSRSNEEECGAKDL